MPHLVDHQTEVITAVVERARYIAVGQDPVAEDDIGIVFADAHAGAQRLFLTRRSG